MKHEGRVLRGWMAFTLYIGAAHADASSAQRQQLHSRVMPTIRELAKRDIPPERTRQLMHIVGEQVRAIMGKEWQPQGEWMSTIDAMIGEGDGR